MLLHNYCKPKLLLSSATDDTNSVQVTCRDCDNLNLNRRGTPGPDAPRTAIQLRPGITIMMALSSLVLNTGSRQTCRCVDLHCLVPGTVHHLVGDVQVEVQSTDKL